MTLVFSGCDGVYEGEYLGTIDVSKIESLSKEMGKEFRILQFTDTQARTPSEQGDAETMIARVLEKLKGEEKTPDLIVLTGDNVWGGIGIALQNNLIKCLEGTGIPYAPVFGNHDTEGGSLEYMGDIWEAGKNSLFKKGPEDVYGVGNYVLNITQDGEIVYNLYFLDSNGYRTYTAEDEKSEGWVKWDGTNYDYIYPNQIAWFKANVVAINTKAGVSEGKTLPSLAFFHIPVPEFRAINNYMEGQGPDNKELDPLNWKLLISSKKNPLVEVDTNYIIISQGVEDTVASTCVEHLGVRTGETICSPKVNTGFFEAGKANGLKGIFVGHDHVNNFVFNYEGVILGYGLKTGSNSYFRDEMQGGTLIVIEDDSLNIAVEHIFVEAL